jgi:heavy metal sensor kinase
MGFDRVRAWLDRIEMRLALRVALVTVGVAAATVVVAYVEASDEILEEVEADLSRELEMLSERAERDPTEWERSLAPLLDVLHEQKRVLRWLEADGGTRDARGTWPAPARVIPRHATKLDAIRAGPDAFAARAVRLPDGSVLQGAASLSHFVEEREEFRRRLLLAFAFGLAVAGSVSLWLTRSALAPLRRATLAVEGVDASRLEARIPTRGTGDVVDRHAEALNRVLARLEWAFARMRGFSADAAHELRTPINRILTVTDVASLDETDPAHWQRALGRVRASAEEMRRLVDSLLLLARGEEGRLRLQRSLVPMPGFLEELADLYRPLAEETRVEIQVAGEPGSLRADRELLGRALANLIENAIRHAPPGGVVRLEEHASPEGLVVSVADSGSGVPLADREWIFERFTQRDPARASGASGLGLPIARMIARLHGGDVTAHDSPLGGTGFSIRLPAPHPL